MGVDIDVLRWFQQVADGATVTEVSELEQVSQPGVSRALARLEAEVGTPLLRRSGRTLRMTRAGVTFKKHVDRVVHELDDGLAAVSQLLDPGTGTVTVAFQLSLGTWLIPDLVSSFRADHPGVRFVLRQVRDELASAVPDDPLVDLEITTLRPETDGIAWRRLLDEPLRLAVPADHSLAGRERVGLAEVSDDAFVALTPTFLLRRTVDGLCRAAGFEPEVAFETEDLATVRAFVAAGLGVAVVPALHAGPAGTADAVRHLELTDPDALREIGVAWSAERRRLPASELFLQHVVDRAAAARFPEVLGGP